MGECVLTRRSVVKNESQLLADVIVSGSAVSQVDLTGLNITKDGEYELVIYYGDPSVGISIYLSVGNDFTLSNYYSQVLSSSGTSVTALRLNSPLVASRKAEIFVRIKLTNNGYFVFQSDMIQGFVDNTPVVQNMYASSTFTMTSISLLRISASSSNAIPVGSRFQLYKVGG